VVHRTDLHEKALPELKAMRLFYGRWGEERHWSPDGRFPMDDMEALAEKCLPLIDPADLTPETIERHERRQEEIVKLVDQNGPLRG
jgi:hypothetical protein